MLTNLILILGFIFLGFLVWWFSRKGNDKTDSNSFLMLQNQLNELTKTMDSKMGDSFKQIQNQSIESNRISKDVVRELTELRETNKNVLNFADQLKSFQDILKNPKQRGTIVGEYYLETILSRVLPPKTFKTQFYFKNGDAVDAAIFVGEKIIPVDSKFSLDNYNRIIEANKDGTNPETFINEFKKDIKKRVDETSKYIRPGENTLDFAFMFIPHESIYYDLLVAEVGSIKVNTQDLIQYAFERKVIIVSPTSFLAYLQTVLHGLRGMQIEEATKEIIKNVDKLGKHISVYKDFLSRLGGSLRTTVGHYISANKELKKVDTDIMKISGDSPGVEVLEIEKPDEG